MTFRHSVRHFSVAVFIGAVCAVSFSRPNSVYALETIKLEYQSRHPLSNPTIDGQPARIHSQGLFVTKDFFYITGRLETPPKRALLLRYSRRDPRQCEVLDITPPASPENKRDRLDHPGGFDFDGTAFWIPVSVSRPNSTTAVVRVAATEMQPLGGAKVDTPFRVEDHLGAIAFDRKEKKLYGANWDTKSIFVMSPQGRVLKKVNREELFQHDPGWSLAVQDWKFLGDGRILAGGLDKGRPANESASRAVVELINISGRSRLAQTRLRRPPGSRHAATREGLAIRGEHVFLLPGDLGDDAAVFKYIWKRDD